MAFAACEHARSAQGQMSVFGSVIKLHGAASQNIGGLHCKRRVGSKPQQGSMMVDQRQNHIRLCAFRIERERAFKQGLGRIETLRFEIIK
jgi:hypothetical protein